MRETVERKSVAIAELDSDGYDVEEVDDASNDTVREKDRPRKSVVKDPWLNFGLVTASVAPNQKEFDKVKKKGGTTGGTNNLEDDKRSKSSKSEKKDKKKKKKKKKNFSDMDSDDLE